MNSICYSITYKAYIKDGMLLINSLLLSHCKLYEHIVSNLSIVSSKISYILQKHPGHKSLHTNIAFNIKWPIKTTMFLMCRWRLWIGLYSNAIISTNILSRQGVTHALRGSLITHCRSLTKNLKPFSLDVMCKTMAVFSYFQITLVT